MTGRTDALKTALRTDGQDRHTLEQAVATLADYALSAEKTLAAVEYLDGHANDDGGYDQLILDALTPLIEREARFESEGTYLAAVKKLAEVALRNHRWTIASNALLVLDSREPEDVPTWVRTYRMKLFFRLDAEASFDDPVQTFGLLGPLDRLDEQGHAVVREYFAQARDFFLTLPDGETRRQEFIAAVEASITPLRAYVSEAWERLTQQGPCEEGADEPVLVRRPIRPPRHTHVGPDLSPGDPRVPGQEVSAPVEQGPSPITSTEPAAPGDRLIDAHGDPAIAERLYAMKAELAAWRERALNAEAGISSSAVLTGGTGDVDESNHAGFVDATTPTGGTPRFRLGRRHVLVLGAIQSSPNDLQGIAKKYGITKEQIRFETDYGKLTNFDLETLRYSHQCAGVLIGAVPHSMRNVGSSSSAVTLLREGDGFPPSVPMYAGNELKATKTSFRRALEELHDQLLASNAPTIKA